MTGDEKEETIRMHLSLIMQHLLPSYAIALPSQGEGLRERGIIQTDSQSPAIIKILDCAQRAK
jgi:hypothetical protein